MRREHPAAVNVLLGYALSGEHLLDILRDATPVCGIPSFPVSTFVPAGNSRSALHRWSTVCGVDRFLFNRHETLTTTSQQLSSPDSFRQDMDV